LKSTLNVMFVGSIDYIHFSVLKSV